MKRILSIAVMVTLSIASQSVNAAKKSAAERFGTQSSPCVDIVGLWSESHFSVN